MDVPQIRPSRLYYLLSVIVLLAGIGVLAWRIGSMVAAFAGSPLQVVVPGKGLVVLERPAKYAICYEYRSVVNGKVYHTQGSIPALECRMVLQATGEQLPLERMRGSYTYTFGSRAGVGIWNVRVDRPGTYELSAWYPDGVEGPEQVVLAVQEFNILAMVFGILAAALAFLLCLGGAAAIFIVTLVRRTSCKTRLAAASLDRPPGGPAGPPPPPGPGDTPPSKPEIP